MHPVIAQAIAAERARELHAQAAAAGLARQLRRSRRPRLFPRLPIAARGPAVRPTAQPLRTPRAA